MSTLFTLPPPQAQDSLPESPGQALTEIPVQEPTGLDRVMLSEDKLFVVLAVVLLIWAGIVFFLYRTDRRIARLERSVEGRIPAEDEW